MRAIVIARALHDMPCNTIDQYERGMCLCIPCPPTLCGVQYYRYGHRTCRYPSICCTLHTMWRAILPTSARRGGMCCISVHPLPYNVAYNTIGTGTAHAAIRAYAASPTLVACNTANQCGRGMCVRRTRTPTLQYSTNCRNQIWTPQ